MLVAIGTAATALGALSPSTGASASSPAALRLTASSPSATIGSSLDLTATVTGSSPTGAVEFLDDGTPLACGGSDTVGLTSGATDTASCDVAALGGPAGEQAITALYLGDAANQPAAATLDETVSAAPTSTLLTATPSSAGTGTPVAYQASVEAAGRPVTAGTVLFSDDGSPVTSCQGGPQQSIVAGLATCTLPSGYPVEGIHLVEATFSGTTSLATSDATLVEAVGGTTSTTATTTRLFSSSTAPLVGAPVTLGAVVTSSGSSPAPPSGSVTFTQGGRALPGCKDLAVAQVARSSQASAACDLPSGVSSAGPYDLGALFEASAASGLASSAASSTLLTARTGAATVTLDASPDPAVTGTTITLDASVTSDATGLPAAGQVQIDLGGSPAACAGATSGLLTLTSGGATCSLPAPSPGQTLATAVYLGSATLSATSASAPLTVDPALAPSTVTVTASPDPAPTGTAVTYTATVTGGAVTPTGAVDFSFSLNGAAITGCGGQLLTSGIAKCTIDSGYATTGTVVVVVTYGGDSGHLPGAGALSEVIGTGTEPTPALQLSGPPMPVTLGAPVTYEALLTGAAAAPTGSVAFADDGTVICGSAPLSQVGSSNAADATCSLPSGYSTDLSHTIVASYIGDATHGPASAALNVSVAHAQVKVLSNVSPSPLSVASLPTLQIGLNGEIGEPTGSITFAQLGSLASKCGTSGSTAQLSLGSAACTFGTLPSAGLDSYVASYSGDNTYAPTVVALADETSRTGIAQPTVTLGATPAATVGSDVHYTVTVSGGAGTPSGTVTLSDGGTSVGTCGLSGVMMLVGGTAACDAGTGLAAGVHELVASFSGNATYAPGAALLAVPVTGAASTSSETGSTGGSTTGSTGGSTTDSTGGSTTGSTGGAAGGTTGSSGGGTTVGDVGAPPGSTTTSIGVGSSTPGGSSTTGKVGPGRPAPGASAPAPGGSQRPPGGKTSSGPTPRPGRSPRRPPSRIPRLAVSAPRLRRTGQKVVYRAHLAGHRGPVRGTVTFSVDGRPVRGCSRIPLGGSSSLQVTCTLAAGFPSSGYRVIAVAYSGSARYARRRTRILEHVLPTWQGYWLIAPSGRLYARGGAWGATSRKPETPVVAAALAPDARGLWLLSRAGAITTTGAIASFGSPRRGSGPYSAIAPTIDGRGYWVLASDGTVHAFGDAHPYGSARATRRTGPFVALAATPDGGGYWLLSSSGRVVARGDARVEPSAKTSPRPHRPAGHARFVGIAASAGGHGYWLLQADGAVRAFGHAPAYGGAAAGHTSARFVGILPTADHRGYWLARSNGLVISRGNAPHLAARTTRPGRILAITGT